MGVCECRPGEQTSCGGGRGECTPGVKTCNSNGLWSDTCVGEGRPSRELCDGKDNDCNGLVDDSPSDLLPCANDAGVCSTAHHQCVDGGQVACTVADYPKTYEATEVSCDGLDNDCDGLVDVTRPVPLAPQTGAWGFYNVDAGFAAVYARSAADGGDELVVARFDPLLAAVGSPFVVRGGALIDWAAGAFGSDLYLAWLEGSALQAVRLDAQDVAHPFAPYEDAGYASNLKLGVSDRLVLTYFAGGLTSARMVRWGLDGGLVLAADINRAPGTARSGDVAVVNVSRKGRYGVYTADPLDGGDLISQVVDLDSMSAAQTDAYYYGGEATVLVDLADGGLSTAYTYFDPVKPWSGLYIDPNLIDASLSEITVVEDRNDISHYGSSDATLSETNELDFVFQDNTAQALVFAHMIGGAPQLSGPLKPVPATLIGFGVPMLAQPARGQLLGLALHSGSALSGLRICGAR